MQLGGAKGARTAAAGVCAQTENVTGAGGCVRCRAQMARIVTGRSPRSDGTRRRHHLQVGLRLHKSWIKRGGGHAVLAQLQGGGGGGGKSIISRECAAAGEVGSERGHTG